MVPKDAAGGIDPSHLGARYVFRHDRRHGTPDGLPSGYVKIAIENDDE